MGHESLPLTHGVAWVKVFLRRLSSSAGPGTACTALFPSQLPLLFTGGPLTGRALSPPRSPMWKPSLSGCGRRDRLGIYISKSPSQETLEDAAGRVWNLRNQTEGKPPVWGILASALFLDRGAHWKGDDSDPLDLPADSSRLLTQKITSNAMQHNPGNLPSRRRSTSRSRGRAPKLAPNSEFYCPDFPYQVSPTRMAGPRLLFSSSSLCSGRGWEDEKGEVGWGRGSDPSLWPWHPTCLAHSFLTHQMWGEVPPCLVAF